MDKTALTSTIIGVLGGILGVCIGQIMGAHSESDKFVREKLQESYYRILGIPQIEDDLHSSAINTISNMNADLFAAKYNKEHEKFTNEVKYIISISDLYERNLSPQTLKFAECSKKLMTVTSNHFLLEAQTGGRPIAGQLTSYSNPNKPLTKNESLTTIVNVKNECNKSLDRLRLDIANVMQKHL